MARSTPQPTNQLDWLVYQNHLSDGGIRVSVRGYEKWLCPSEKTAVLDLIQHRLRQQEELRTSSVGWEIDSETGGFSRWILLPFATIWKIVWPNHPVPETF